MIDVKWQVATVNFLLQVWSEDMATVASDERINVEKPAVPRLYGQRSHFTFLKKLLST